jgi:hypothetical protein
MVFNLLRKAFVDMQKQDRAYKRLTEDKKLPNDNGNEIKEQDDLKLEQRWWLENIFVRFNLSFLQGAFLIYGGISLIRFTLIFGMIGQVSSQYLLAFASTFLGDLFIPISLIIINSLYKSLQEMKTQINTLMCDKKLVAPAYLISNNELKSPQLLNELDNNYRRKYLSNIAFRSLQNGLILSFDAKYQIGSGAIAAIIFLVIAVLRYVLGIFPANFWSLTLTHVGFVDFTVGIHAIIAIAFDWFLIGAIAWTLFVSFLITIQASEKTVRIRSFESIKNYFEPSTRVLLKTSFVLTFLVAWLSPLLLVWTLFPEGLAALSLMESILAITLPIIAFSIIMPILIIHKGMENTRKRALILKAQQLEDIISIKENDLDKYLKLQKHLIIDYKNIERKSEWNLDGSHVFQIFGTIIFPLVTFTLSILLK